MLLWRKERVRRLLLIAKGVLGLDMGVLLWSTFGIFGNEDMFFHISVC